MFFGDEFPDLELAGEQFFEVFDEVLVFRGEGLGGDPAGDAAAVFEFAADFVGAVGEADEFDFGVHFEDAASAASFFGGEDDGGFHDEELDGVLGEFVGVNDAGVAIEFGNLRLAADFRCGRGDEGNGECPPSANGEETWCSLVRLWLKFRKKKVDFMV